ncbi:hypothetical protein ABZ345_34215 [Lentzea sp. NPDC005914]|uniref:hypothetical protein n=1 Tax=Lentzea sp. NPDC005914 TaxID=3154572 RepID=UPI0033CD1C19
MYIVRDNSRDGVAVSWGTDRERLDQIAATSPDYEIWPDLNASDYYWHEHRHGIRWVHPYDLDAQREAEIKP